MVFLISEIKKFINFWFFTEFSKKNLVLDKIKMLRIRKFVNLEISRLKFEIKKNLEIAKFLFEISEQNSKM